MTISSYRVLSFPTCSASQLLTLGQFFGVFVVNVVSSRKAILFFDVGERSHHTPHGAEMGHEFFGSGRSSLGVRRTEHVQP